jgi:hypothetical protein
MSLPPLKATWMRRPLSRVGMVVLVAIIVLAPAWQFRDILTTYRLYSDDFAYVAASRTQRQTIENLFVPHNTHIVPFWRVLTWALAAAAGKLSNLPKVLAAAAYGIHVAVMLLMGRLVARETGRAVVGLSAMVAIGSSFLIAPSATWFSASQTLWAGFGILSMLYYLQGWRRAGGGWRLVAACLMTWLAAGSWSVGHAAGPVGAVYLWVDGRPRCRKVAWLPLAATLLAVAVAMSLGGKRINATISFGGRTTLEATDPVQGIFHTLQAIPENLIFGNLGLITETTTVQGAMLTLAVALAWVLSWRRGRPNPLECAGGALLLLSYLVEWTVRGYLPFESLRGLVPWYDTIPDIGFVLFAAGWWTRLWPATTPSEKPAQSFAVPTRAQALGVLVFQAALLALHQPRVEALFRSTLPGMTVDERGAFPIPTLQHMRFVFMATERARWQQHTWARLDQAEAIARRMGVSRQELARAFGRVDAPDLPKVYDAADMLDLPDQSTATEPTPARIAEIRAALDPWLSLEPDPAPAGYLIQALGIKVRLTDEERRRLEMTPVKER